MSSGRVGISWPYMKHVLPLPLTSSRWIVNSDTSSPRLFSSARVPAAASSTACAAAIFAASFSSSRAARAAVGPFARLSCSHSLVCRSDARASERAASASARAARSAAAPAWAASTSCLRVGGGKRQTNVSSKRRTYFWFEYNSCCRWRDCSKSAVDDFQTAVARHRAKQRSLQDLIRSGMLAFTYYWSSMYTASHTECTYFAGELDKPIPSRTRVSPPPFS